MITFQTTDCVTIAGEWNAPAGATKAILLLHMMPATRKSWQSLSQALNQAGFATLAIDLRGHGESTIRQAQDDKQAHGDKRLDYKNFSDAEHQTSRLDIDAAMNFLKSKGFAEKNISFVGASIGANLALDALHRYSRTRRAVILSPGLDYRGLQTEPSMAGLDKNQCVWLIAAEEDRYSADSSRALGKLRPDISRVTIFQGREHGTNLFTAYPKLIAEILGFLSARE